MIPIGIAQYELNLAHETEKNGKIVFSISC